MFFFSLLQGLNGVFIFLLSAAAAIWAFLDARRRGHAAWLWAGIAFSIFPIGLAAYLVYRAAVKVGRKSPR